MSVFNTVDVWSTRCGEDETYSFHSIIVTDLDDSGQDKIIVGSFSGLLRIYQVTYDNSEQASFKPADLLLEIQLGSCITQVTAGKLVSGSRSTHIGVVYSRSIGVYSFSVVPGSTEHGNQFELKMLYEQPLQHINYQVLVAPFGGVQGRDFLCAVAVDGTLSFFEQETFVFESQLPTFLLPSPLTYVAKSDVFVTLSADWYIEAYRYQDLVNTVRKKVTPAWSYNLGETLLDIQSREPNTNDEAFVFALSEHCLLCWNANGLLQFVKRLQYTPICFYPYIVNEHKNDLMILVVSDSGTLFVYERCTLRWSAKLPFIPLCIVRANLAIDGLLVLLSDIGELNCCILGTRPSLFVAPALENSLTNFKNMNQKLEKLQEEIKDFKANNNDTFSLAVSKQEISVTLKALPYDKSQSRCQLLVDLTPSRPLSDVHITFESRQPFDVQPPTCESTSLSVFIEIAGDSKDIIVSKLDVTAVVRYMVADAVPRLIRRRAAASARFVLMPCAANDDECIFKLNVHSSKPPPLLTTLFQEFRDDQWLESGCNDEISAFCLRYNPSKKCIIYALKSSKYGFTLASNSLPMTYLLLSQLVYRCKHLRHASEKKLDSFSFEYNEQVPKEELLTVVKEYVSARNKVHELQVLLEKLSAQYRLIQRRLLIKLKDKIPSNLSSVQVLYQSTYDKLIDTIRGVEEGQKELLCKSCDLQAIIDLTFDLISMKSNVSADHVSKLRNAMNLTTMNNETQGWGERTLANVTYLLRTVLYSTSRDEHRVLPPPDELVTDATKLTNVIATAINRILGIVSSFEEKGLGPVTRLDQIRAVSPILELDEIDENHSQEKTFKFLRQEKLLDKRRSEPFVDVSTNL